MNINENEDNIIALLRQKNYNEALIEVANQLQSYPTNNFLLRTEIYILFRLNKIDKAKTLADSTHPIVV